LEVSLMESILNIYQAMVSAPSTHLSVIRRGGSLVEIGRYQWGVYLLEESA
jgi:hypothetical protein